MWRPSRVCISRRSRASTVDRPGTSVFTARARRLHSSTIQDTESRSFLAAQSSMTVVSSRSDSAGNRRKPSRGPREARQKCSDFWVLAVGPNPAPHRAFIHAKLTRQPINARLQWAVAFYQIADRAKAQFGQSPSGFRDIDDVDNCRGLYQGWGCTVTNQAILAPAMAGEILDTARGIGRPVCHRALRSVPEAASARLRRSNTSAGAYPCAD